MNINDARKNVFLLTFNLYGINSVYSTVVLTAVHSLANVDISFFTNE